MIKKMEYIFIFFFSLSCIFSMTAQTDYVTSEDLKGKNLKNYNKAIEAYKQGEEDKALDLFISLLDKTPTLIDAHLRVGSLYFDKGSYDNSEKSFESALALDPEYDKRVYFSLANVQRSNKKFKQAAQNFQEYIDRSERETEVLRRARKYMRQMLFAAQAQENPVPFDPKKLNENINGLSSEYLPSISADGLDMIFTVRNGGQEDLYKSKYENDEWKKRSPLEELNTEENEGAHTMSGDGKLLVFAKRTRNQGFDLYYSKKHKGQWTRPRNLGDPINTRHWESQPCLSADGKMLYFSSNRTGGKGGNDIWVSKKDNNGRWLQPVNLGEEINTIGNEESPFIHHDNQTLYFRSNHHLGIGDYDIFYSKKKGKKWNEVTNLGYPINTIGSEGAMIVSLDGKTAYFASDMEGKRNLDIYQFELYEEARPEQLSYIKANIYHAETREALIDAEISIKNLDTESIVIEKQLLDENDFITAINRGQNYAIHVAKEGFVFYSESFITQEKSENVKPLDIDIYLDPIPKEVVEESTPVVLKNVFFNSGSAILLTASQFELDRLKSLLVHNPLINIQINGHTDSVGDPKANKILSENRAKAVYDYLIEGGIPGERLKYKGFGESKPVDTNETEEGKQNNRRTEFVIIPD